MEESTDSLAVQWLGDSTEAYTDMTDNTDTIKFRQQNGASVAFRL